MDFIIYSNYFDIFISEKKMKIVYIYILIDPRNDRIRYVGKTQNTKARLQGHIWDITYTKEKSHKKNWIKGLVKQNLKPIMEVLDEVPEEEWQFWERHYISLLKSWGIKLLNISEGGGTVTNTPRISKKRKKSITRWWSQRKKDKHYNSPEAKKKRQDDGKRASETYKNNPNYNSLEEKKKRSEPHKGEKHPNYGKNLTSSTRKSISLGWEKLKATPEYNSIEEKKKRSDRIKKGMLQRKDTPKYNSQEAKAIRKKNARNAALKGVEKRKQNREAEKARIEQEKRTMIF